MDQGSSGPATISWTQVETDMRALLASTLGGLLEGAAEDLQTFGAAIAKDFTAAAQLPDAAKRDSLLSELKGQVPNLGEINRLRAVNAEWDVANRVVGVAIDGMLAGLKYVPGLLIV